MIFAAKTGSSQQSRSRTPQKSSNMFPSSAKQPKKEGTKHETAQKDKNGKENITMKYKTKDSFMILQNL